MAILPVQEYERLFASPPEPSDTNISPTASEDALSLFPLQPTQTKMQDINASRHQGLTPLSGLTDQELAVLAQAVVAPDRLSQLNEALAKNHSRSLSSAERLSLDGLLDNLLADVDQVALLKARALYTLQLRRTAAQTAA